MNRAAAWVVAGAVLLAGVHLPVVAQGYRIVRPIRVKIGEGYADFGYHFQRAKRRPELGGINSEQTEKTWLAGVKTEIEGSLLHPSLLPFSLGGTLRIRRGTADETRGRLVGRQDSNDSDYRFRLGILPAYKWSGELMLMSFVQEIDSAFAPARLVRRRTEVFSLRHQSRTWPLRFQWRRGRNWGIKGDPRDERRSELGARLSHRSDALSVLVQAERQDYTETSVQQDYVTDRLNTGISYRPGGSRKIQIATRFYGYDRRGTSNSKFLLSSGSIDLRPTEDLHMNLLLEYQDQEEDIGARTSRRAKFNASHELWGSLSTRLYGLLERQILPFDGALDVNEAILSFDYQRHLEAGALGLGWTRGQRREDEVLPSGERLMIEEHTYDQGFPIFLDLPDVISGSVTVTSTDGSIVYTENMDYELVQRDLLTEIRIVPTGDILPGTTLRISYLVNSVPDLSTIIDSRSVSASWRGTQGLWLRASHVIRDNNQVAGLPDVRLEDLTDTELRVGYDRERWGVHGAWRDRVSTILGYRTSSLGSNWDAISGRVMTLTLRARLQKTTYPDRAEPTDSRLFGADLRFERERLRVDMTLERWKENVLGRKGDYFQGRLMARWLARAIEVRLLWLVRFQTVELSGVDNRDEVQIVVRRQFR